MRRKVMEKTLSSIYLLFVWQKTKLLAVASKICKLFNKTIVYESKTGLKEINPLFPTKQREIINLCTVSPDELFLGIDFLKDEYSLIDTPIKESPHFELMASLYNGEDGLNTNYTKRMLKGALDERYEILAFYLDKEYFKNCFSKKYGDIKNNLNERVTIYKKNGKCYIHDGKHRAALCSFLDIPVQCEVVDFYEVCKEFNNNKLKIVQKKEKYKKHDFFLKA